MRKIYGAMMMLALGCGGAADETGADETGETTAGTDAPTTGEPGGCGLVEPPCADVAIQDLSLHDDKVSEARVESSKDGDDWLSIVDASAGGTMMAAMNPWVYVRFTDEGLERVSVDDVTAQASADWDVAAKRYGIRANSGDSGSSCVTVAELTGDYASVTAAPGDGEFKEEAFYDAGCGLIEDGSGLPGNPDYRMKNWWGYTGCVTTSGVPFAIRLADGRTVKLVVESYYESGQEACNSDGTMGTNGAVMTWRWSFLP